MLIQEYHPLDKLHTFRLPAEARLLITIETRQDLIDLHRQGFFREPFIVLGEGSNTLFVNDVEDPVLLMRIRGMERLQGAAEESVLVKAGAGEHWDDLVNWSVGQGLGGIEHLASIPGTCGAAPVQNIGAYGRELSQVTHGVEVFDTTEGRILELSPDQCGFAYRESIFKRPEGKHWIILSITLRLAASSAYRPDTSYKALADELAAGGFGPGADQPALADVWTAVKRIRASKLPDPAITPNAGSFFKNPVIPEDQARTLQQVHPGMPSYPDSPGWRKIPAGWLIEQTGWKGRRQGAVGTWPNQALVLIQAGGASGGEVVEVMNRIQDDVDKAFGIRLQTEVNLVPPPHG